MSNWKTLLLRIGENGPEYGTSSDAKEHIETCFGVIRREIDRSGDEVLSFLLQCAEQLPHKIPLYATLVGLLNLENEDFVKKMVESIQTEFQAALDSGNCDKIRILLRFLTALLSSKVLQPGSVVVVFETLLSSAATTVDEEKANPSWQAQADFYVVCILSSLPWGGAELAEQVPDEMERIIVGIQAYLSIRKHSSDSGLSFFQNDDESGNSLAEKDFVEDLWDQIQALAANGWKLDSVPRPHLSFEAQLVAGKSHELGPIKCPEQPAPPAKLSRIITGEQKHEAEMRYPQRIRRLNIFPAGKTEDLQPIDRFVVQEYLLDVLLYFNGSRRECASYMVSLPVPFRYEYLMAETIFSQLLLLPRPPFKTLYYTLIIMDLCKALPGAFPAVVAGAVRALFEKIADLDMECRTRLILWFSHHLSNFQFIWPWEEWAHVLDLPKWAPQRVFVQEVLQREVRLSYWDKIKQSVENASALEELLPPKGGPNFKYSFEDGKEKTEEHQLSADLNSMVKGKQTARDIISWVEESVYPAQGFEVTLAVVVQTLLDIGSKSFTHLIIVLERYGQVFAKLCPDNDKQVMLISEISTYWKNNAQMTAVAIDRMMGYRLLSNQAIVRWVFSSENVDQFHVSDRPWEILGNALSKTYNRTSDLKKEISNLSKNLLVVEKAAAKAKAELEAAETKLSLVEGEPVVGDNPAKMKRLKSQAEKAMEEEVSLRDSIEAKEALLNRALAENESLLLLVYQSFMAVLKERLPDPSKARTLQELKSIGEEFMAVDLEEPSAMEVDNENGNTKKSESKGDKSESLYKVGEREQWCLSTLGYLKAFTRQYASEIWPHMERLDSDVFSREEVHPLFLEAVYSGMRIEEVSSS
ncbi:PREDICTED: nuclear cap-binding protein subunit 1 [Tarenaya hassleriana]|uniref:nuclear cap-binding protein subunit 1 n=1 Tax=Tarenaya hassleriana TaxID=28532 RepID=UPI00053C73EB|nr:PREDICTED: nuclear cap-binding protein subunit 1 [Tarenaya hassleriana]